MASKKAAPPTRVTPDTMKRAVEMLALIDALPPSPEKNKILDTEQYAEWLYHRDRCSVKSYLHKPTEEEKVLGVTKDANGIDIKLWKKGIWCHHCQCSVQEFKRHRNTKKCIKNRAKNEPHLASIRRKAQRVTNNQDFVGFIPHSSIARDASAPNLQMWIDEQNEKALAVPKPIKKKADRVAQQQKIIKHINNLTTKKSDNHKKLLVNKNATQDEIKKAYHKLSKLIHPDKCKLEGTEEAFKSLNNARVELLKDNRKRKK